MSTPLPEFTLDGYRSLLLHLRSLGYRLEPASRVGRIKGRAVFVRHDIDIHVDGADLMGQVEHDLGVCSTWYVLLDAHYNPWHPRAQRELRALRHAGHNFGLHYDLEHCPEGDEHRMLDDGLWRLDDVTGKPAMSIAMHRPARGRPDPLRQHPLNPHRDEIFYVSDSRREWTEPYISQLLAGEPEQAMLCTHHEHWASPAPLDRFAHFDETTVKLAHAATDDFLAGERAAWIAGR